jgi:signal transduction histidine kinase
LRVLASSGGGLWSPNGASLAFRVSPFFWQTVTFKVAVALGAFLLTAVAVALGITRRHRIEVQKLRALHQLDRERARIAQDLHDDLGTSLTQISLLSGLADRETARDELKLLNQQIRQSARAMVSALDEIVWAVNPRNDSVAELVNYLANFAEEFFRASSIGCRLDIPARLPAAAVPSEMRHHLYLVFKESANNVVRHSRATQAWVAVTLAPREVVISIKDNGQGFDASAAGFKPGDGLLNMRSRMEQVGGRADIQSSPGQGTVVIIRMPLAPGGD